jgi:hypothetical protein
MKKASLLLLGCTLLLFACNSTSDKTEEHTEHPHSKTSELALNNGAKWKADSITNHNVVALKTIADNFRIKPAPSVNDYQLLGNDLKNGLDKMIKECKMTGPDHEALHQWLNPLLKENNELKIVTDTAVAKSVFNSIDKQLDEYHNYFE